MNPSENLFFGELLQQFRTRKRLSQKQLAKQIGVSRETVSLWERGYYKPETDTTLYELVRVLGLTEQEQQQLFEAYRVTALTTSFHNSPLERNPYFTGRGPQLANLHKLLMVGKQVALTQAIGGLGGIGKTQLALEYAYRYQKSYHDIFWAVADTYESLMTSYIHFAALLHLPESEESDQNKVKKAVMHWFRQHTGWLLILDNIEDLSQVQQFVPLDRQGAVLLTTRRQVTEPVAQALELGVLSENDGILFLLKRTKNLTFEMALDDASAHDIAAARAITQAIGHLPLALDQAGAYILETGCSVANYLEVFQKHRVELLRRRAGREIPTDHPESVTTTFTLSFQQVQQRSKVAAELLRVCAFLAPEGIGEELLVQGASKLGPLLQPLGSNGLLLDQAIEALRAFSLIQRDQEKKTLSIHRLVQAVLKDSMSRAARRRWATCVVQCVNAAFPWTRQGTQEQRERLLPHALECAQVISAEKVHTREAVLLLDNCAVMLVGEHNYNEAERLYEEALTLAEVVLGPESPEATVVLNNQQLLFYGRDRYQRIGSFGLGVAKALLDYYKFSENAREASEHSEYLGTHDESLYALAESIHAQGKDEQIEQLTQWTLEVATAVSGVDHTEVAVDLNNLAELLESLALLHREHDDVAQAEVLYHRALLIREQASGFENRHISISLASLASLYKAQGKYEQAESFFERVLAVDTKIWEGGIAGQRGPGIVTRETLAIDLYNLVQVYYLQGKCEQAESRYEQALTLTGEGQIFLRGRLMMETMEGLTECYKGQGKYEQAKLPIQRAMTRFEEVWGPEYYGKAEDLCALASLYKAQGEYDQAESLYKQALAFGYAFVGGDNLRDIGLFYKDCGKYDEAEPLLKRALAYQEEYFERMLSDWPSDLMWPDPMVDDVVRCLSDLAGLYEAQGKDEQAEPLLQRALTLLVDNTHGMRNEITASEQRSRDSY